MKEMNRRMILQAIGGSAFAASAIAGGASAEESSDENKGLGLERTKLAEPVRNQKISDIWGADPVREMRTFLKKERDISVTPNDLDAFLVESSEGNASFHLFRTPLEEAGSREVDFVVRDLEDGARVSATIGNDLYNSGPEVSQQGLESDSPELEGYEIVTGVEWYNQPALEGSSQLKTDSDSTVTTAAAPSCDFTWNYAFGLDAAPPNWVCEAVAYLGGVALIVYPEPTTSVGGVAVITITVASGGCSVAYTIEDETGINLGATVVVCLNSACNIDGFGVNCDFDFRAWVEP